MKFNPCANADGLPSITVLRRVASRQFARALVIAFNVILVVMCNLVFAGSASAASTGGSGGAFTDRTFQSFTASNGLSSQYHVFSASLSQAAPLCAIFQFHGDGAYEFRNPTSAYALGGVNGIVAQSRQRGCLTVSILSPDKTGAITWWESGAANALFARDLLNKIKAEYNVDTKQMWLVGYSGGAQLITQFYLPLYSSSLDGGGAVVFGGGGRPYNFADNAFAPALTAAFHLHWYTGAADNGSGGTYNALSDASKGEALYSGKGFSTSHEYPANTAHALDGRFGGVLARQLDLAGSGTIPDAPVNTNPSPPSVAWVHSVAPTRNGVGLNVNVPSGTTRTTLRVSASPFGTQTGFYTYTSRTGSATVITLSSGLTPGRTYYYQIESGTDRRVVAAGKFSTAM